MKKHIYKGPRVLVFDIETAPILAHVWDIWDQNVGLNQIQKDWHVLSWSAKWLGNSKIMYADQRKAKDVSDDTKLLEGIWDLLDEADIVITQNGIKFDVKKLNARFIIQGVRKGHPPSSFKHIDTARIAWSRFGFTSNKLEYLTDKLCKKYKKLKHTKFPGHELWVQCLAGNKAAWVEMEKYNKHDVLALEELYHKMIPWAPNAINFNLYHDDTKNTCKCGGTKFKKNGYKYTTAGKYQRYKCAKCGTESRSAKNLFSKEKKAALHRI
jgi:uncharacterized protein YprB with RNaseH-like and TPR domain